MNAVPRPAGQVELDVIQEVTQAIGRRIYDKVNEVRVSAVEGLQPAHIQIADLALSEVIRLGLWHPSDGVPAFEG